MQLCNSNITTDIFYKLNIRNLGNKKQKIQSFNSFDKSVVLWEISRSLMRYTTPQTKSLKPSMTYIQTNFPTKCSNAQIFQSLQNTKSKYQDTRYQTQDIYKLIFVEITPWNFLIKIWYFWKKVKVKVKKIQRLNKKTKKKFQNVPYSVIIIPIPIPILIPNNNQFSNEIVLHSNLLNCAVK